MADVDKGRARATGAPGPGTESSTSTDSNEKHLIAGKAVPPPVELPLPRFNWEKHRVIHRVHQEKYSGNEFNPGVSGNARFSPIKASDGKAIRTLYGADSFRGAVMESVFHDVPYTESMKTYDKQKLAGQAYTQLSASHDLTLADLSSVALRGLGVQRSQMIDTEKDQYPITRQWAAAIHAQHKDIHGICWISRQDDNSKSVVLFGDRVEPGTLAQLSPSTSVVSDPVCYANLLDLAELLQVCIVPGREASSRENA